ncbi:roadblock/LC7 domain-containing protein [Plantactinospora sonchi]|uniref:Roadblock/LC7 domain-containing protein n=1 Tax=Plantactinospora sonchi TaxID=1544735 RepID=A0ABU7RN47_9ACTN
MTQFRESGQDLFADPLPRRSPGARLDSGGEENLPEETFAPPPPAPLVHSGGTLPGRSAVHVELGALRERVPGVRGTVLAGVDGRLIGHDLNTGPEPLDLAALAATTFGLGRQCGLTLRQGRIRELTVHSDQGYFTVYGVSDDVLLAVLGDDRLNVSWLHLEAGPVAERIADLLHVGGTA